MRRRALVLVVGLLTSVDACAPRPAEVVEPALNPVRAEVTNNFALAMEVFAVGSGINHRMGTVHPGMVGRFVLPLNLIGGNPVEFQAHTLGTRQQFRSQALLLAPGAVVDIVIATVLFNSTATIRP